MRGVALQPPLDRDTVTRLGAALFDHLREAGRPTRVLLAGDTRVSTATLAEWVGGAFAARGGQVAWAGVLPTPAVSHLLRDLGGFGAGVVVSASHNPADDNGIKLVGADGVKWPVDEETALEARLFALAGSPASAPLPAANGDLAARTLELILATLTARALDGLFVVVDAANGAASALAEPFFTRLGARVRVIHDRPDGRNINASCGALHPDALAAEVVRLGADAGVALDGDADRAILIAPSGRVLDGDDVLLVWARALAAAGRLPGMVAVATVMSNLGLEVALRRAGITLLRSAVGDREVWDVMQQSGAALGGEQSGHVICSHLSASGDGLLTAAHVMAIAHAAGRSLAEFADLHRFPQVLLNVRVATRRPLEELDAMRAAIRAAEAALDGHGRVFVRYSGTEPLLRIMVEADSEDEARGTAERLAATARAELGAP
jgi:phosphoglucosamine mutase